MKLTSTRCQCAACKQYFNSTGAFEKHRSGSHKKDTRHCLSPDQMRDKGMLINNAGYWCTSLWKRK